MTTPLPARPLVLYHADCADGFAAAWSAWKKFGPEADYLPVQHGTPPPLVEAQNRLLYILDFSYKRPDMEKLANSACWPIVVLDHHESAQKELESLKSSAVAAAFLLEFDITKSGGRLAWEHFHPGTYIPWLVQYTEDRDLWLWKLPSSREISAWLGSVDWSFEDWDLYDNPGNKEEESRIEQGAAILRYQKRLIDKAVKNASEIKLAGHKILAVNSTVCISEIAGKLARGRPFGACWFVRQDGKKVWSLRSTEEGLNVSDVAHSLGGGGHPHAAGFEE